MSSGSGRGYATATPKTKEPTETPEKKMQPTTVSSKNVALKAEAGGAIAGKPPSPLLRRSLPKYTRSPFATSRNAAAAPRFDFGDSAPLWYLLKY
ncbi:unnamed protein product [Linum trigynum]|uniref:Uncharacterized protein n=1 Tax=Linum trigynum TaxID=586398 RepID=A0AAV2F5L9_9ROSI